MKTRRILCLIALLMSCVMALGETYPVYEVVIRPALLTTRADYQKADIIYTVPINSYVLVAREQDGWCLVYTQDELTGFMRATDLKATGKNFTIDITIDEDAIANNDKSSMEFISVDPRALLPDDQVARAE